VNIQFTAIDPVSGWKAELIVRKDRPFSESEVAEHRSKEYFII
jgi:hypothetical protein